MAGDSDMAASISDTSILMVSFDWIVENMQETETVSSKMIVFNGEKVFRVCVKKNPNPNRTFSLIFLVTNLNRMGMRVREVRSGQKNSHYHRRMIERKVNRKEDGENLQLFEGCLDEMKMGGCVVTFSIWIEGSVDGYSYHLSDRLVTHQLWNACARSEHGVDVELVCQDKTLSAHKAILAARSPIFAAEFAKDHPAKDEGVHKIHVHDVDPSTVEEFLYFLYTGQPKSVLANVELLGLAGRYQLTTLEDLCSAAFIKIDVQQMMNCMSSLNSAATGMHEEVKASSSVLTRPDTEIEVDHNHSMSTFQCRWEFETDRSAAKYPKTIVEYHHEKLFSPHLTGDPDKSFTHLVCVNHRHFGFKALSGCYSRNGDIWFQMKTKRAKDVELFLFVGQESESFYKYVKHTVTFGIQMASTIENYHYELMDTSWTTQLWQSALDHQWTDVEVFVGSAKLEAHRVVLSARSPVLSVLLNEIGHLGKSSMAVEDNIDVAVVKVFLKYLYTGRLEMSATNKQLLQLAESYQVETLTKICQLANRISPDVTSQLDALPSKVDISDKPAISFQMDLEVVNLFLEFLDTGRLDPSVKEAQLVALAEMYEAETLSKICKLVGADAADVDKLTTLILTFF